MYEYVYEALGKIRYSRLLQQNPAGLQPCCAEKKGD